MKKVPHFRLALLILLLPLLPNLMLAQEIPNVSKSQEAAFIPVPEVESAIIEIPISLDLAALRDLMEEKIPQSYHFGEEPNDCKRAQWGWADRERIGLNMTGSTIHWQIPVITTAHAHVYALKSFWGKCIRNTKHCQMKFLIPLETRLAIDDNWQLSTVTQKKPLLWEQRCRIKILGLSVGVTRFFEDKLENTLNQKTSEIDQRINQQVKLRYWVQKAWTEMQKPIKLKEGFWLSLQPEELRSTDITGNEQSAELSVGIKLKAKISKSKPSVTMKALPNRAGHFVGEHFRIALEGGVSYEQATEIANRVLSGKHYPIGNQSVSIKQVNRIYASQNGVTAEIEFEGDYTGQLSLTGKPTYDADHQEIFLRDFKYALSTENALLKAAKWLIDQLFINTIQRQLRWSIAQDLKKAKQLAESALNQPLGKQAKLSGKVESIYPKGIYLTPTSIHAHIIATGQAAIHISALNFTRR
jgi:hypothetical protein